METLLRKIFVENFSRKFFSVCAALVIWVVVSNSITTVRVFQRVPVKITNLPQGKTVAGMMPDGFLDQQITVTLSGKKSVLDRMGQGELEVVIDAANRKNDWVAQLTKKNLISLNQDVDLATAVFRVSHSELIIRLCRFVTEKIPISIVPPVGAPPLGYHFLGVWPKKLYHVVSGPEDDVKALRDDGIELEFDLSSISKEDLDAIREESSVKDEISFFVPDSWKKVRIPYLNNMLQPLHCPEMSDIRIDFLYNDLLPIDTNVPVRLFLPEQVRTSTTLTPGGAVREGKAGEFFLTTPLFAANVSRVFLDIAKDYLQVIVLPSTRNDGTYCWEPQFIAEDLLEATYVAKALNEEKYLVSQDMSPHSYHVQQEEYHRARFREYMRCFRLYRGQKTPLCLKLVPQGSSLVVEDVS